MNMIHLIDRIQKLTSLVSSMMRDKKFDRFKQKAEDEYQKLIEKNS